ncbi:MAG TPA: hypothetical protein VGQ59_10900 [Cyclobacteriaceae bacterium]|jgi:hypothetical protein|nr:hypothetical protein [Cyclobacteriaceae bacterium]
MKVTYSENNLTEISGALESGQRKLDIAFYAKGPLSDLPSVYIIPNQFFKEFVSNSAIQFYLNVDFDKEPAEWVIDSGKRTS